MNNKLSLQQKKKLGCNFVLLLSKILKYFLSILSSIPDQVSEPGIGGALSPLTPPSIVPWPGNMLMTPIGQK